MKKRILIISISILFIMVSFLVWKGFRFFHQFWNFAEIAQPIYTEIHDSSPFTKLNIEVVSKNENGLNISDVVYFTNPNQVHIMVVYKKPKQRYHLRAVLLSDQDEIDNFSISSFGETKFLFWNSYRIFFDQIEIREDEIYTIIIRNELDNKKRHDLGRIKFKVKAERNK